MSPEDAPVNSNINRDGIIQFVDREFMELVLPRGGALTLSDVRMLASHKVDVGAMA